MSEEIAYKNIGIIGMGYVGLPLAVAFAEKYQVVGFDINPSRIAQISQHIDNTKEINSEQLKAVLVDNKHKKGLYVSHQQETLGQCNVFIITVPTPIDETNKPLLKPLIMATEAITSLLKDGDIVIYESTVYPGLVEEKMVPILETSGLQYNKGFFVGYSPERINPGDKKHTVKEIVKVTSGSTAKIADIVDSLYASVITAGTYKASSIKVAEAAKVIENAQRDINIAFVNELAKIFGHLGIDTLEVLEAAGTKWNFLPFKPGLVGGHCIGVDPYYLAQKAQEVGYHPEIILAGRRLNDSIGEYVASELVKLMVKKNLTIKQSKVLILGITFKENCPDFRNTRVIDIIDALKEYNINVEVYDPWVDKQLVNESLDIKLLDEPKGSYSGVILSVAHTVFSEIDLKDLLIDEGVVYDVKGFFPREKVDQRL